MSRAAIYAVNNAAQEVLDGGIIDPGAVIRRFGQGLTITGNGIQINGTGYYTLDISITLAPTEVGEITVEVLKNGEEIPGASATVTVAAAADIVNLSIVSLIRETGCCCYNNGPASLTFRVTGADVSVTNIASRVIKL